MIKRGGSPSHPDLPSRQDIRDSIGAIAKAVHRKDDLAIGAVLAGGSNSGHWSCADTAEQDLGQVLQILRRDREHAREPLRLLARAWMAKLERVAGELLMDAVRVLRSREQLADLRWPGHRPILPSRPDGIRSPRTLHVVSEHLTIEIGGLIFESDDHDDEGDVLYVSRGEPQPAAYAALTPEGHAIRYGAGGEVIGVTIINARFILNLDGHLKISLPHEVRIGERALSSVLA